MQVLHHPDPGLVPPSGTVVTIGAYDGVHRGHRAVIARVRELAAERGLETRWSPSTATRPAWCVPSRRPKLLCDLDQRLELLAETGIDYTLVVHFDEVRAKEPAEDFVREVLVGALGARAVVVGDDFHFGHQRQGNVALLTAMGAELGFEVVGLELVGHRRSAGAPRPTRVSSTAIRAALAAGDLGPGQPRCSGGPTRCAGRWCGATAGPATSGSARPTSPSPTRSACPPTGSTPAGTCAPTAWPGPPRCRSAGGRPSTSDADTSLLEAHLLDFDDDLYGEPARVRFVARLRDEEKFDSVDALVAQMAPRLRRGPRLSRPASSPGRRP